ncbi:MAG: ATP-binding cassette domain-containing protein [Ignavibacteriales bacterium]|nr:ATP-binding cassette domain-containing protein [Ignavibacteriales bacterium]
MGPSGSGKSTLMNLIGCLDTPTSGIYRLNGKLVSAMSEDELAFTRNREIGFVFQVFNLLLPGLGLPQRRAASHLRRDEEGRARGEGPPGPGAGRDEGPHVAQAGRALGRRAPARGRRPGPGQRALAPAGRRADRQPRLPDGPRRSSTSSTSIHDQGNTIIMVTHDREVADQAQRIIHIRDGRIEKDERKGA